MRWLARHRAFVFVAVVLVGFGITCATWGALVYRDRGDLARCPEQSGMRAAALHMGAWGEPDTCAYVDPNGEPAPTDSSLAGAAITTGFGSIARPGTLLSVLVAGAVVAAVSRSRPRPGDGAGATWNVDPPPTLAEHR